jgi:hypothetical protein
LKVGKAFELDSEKGFFKKFWQVNGEERRKMPKARNYTESENKFPKNNTAKRTIDTLFRGHCTAFRSPGNTPELWHTARHFGQKPRTAEEFPYLRKSEGIHCERNLNFLIKARKM